MAFVLSVASSLSLSWSDGIFLTGRLLVIKDVAAFVSASLGHEVLRYLLHTLSCVLTKALEQLNNRC